MIIKALFWHQNPKTLRMIPHSSGRSHHNHHWSSIKFHSVGLTLPLDNEVLGKAENWTLTPVLWGPLLMVFCKPHPAYYWRRALFLLCMTAALPLRACFKTVLAVHFTPAAICHSLCRSCDVILRFVSDIRMSWWPSRSVESRFHPLLVCSFVVVPNVCSLTLFLWQAILAGHLESARVAVALVSTVVEQ